MTIDPLYAKRYDRARYNCAHFAVDAWKHITGQDISDRLDGFLAPPQRRTVDLPARSGFRRLQRPESPCLVLMRRPRSAPHVGIYYIDRVLHLHENGVEYQPLDVASRGFKHTRLYACQ